MKRCVYSYSFILVCVCTRSRIHLANYKCGTWAEQGPPRLAESETFTHSENMFVGSYVGTRLRQSRCCIPSWLWHSVPSRQRNWKLARNQPRCGALPGFGTVHQVDKEIESWHVNCKQTNGINGWLTT